MVVAEVVAQQQAQQEQVAQQQRQSQHQQHQPDKLQQLQQQEHECLSTAGRVEALLRSPATALLRLCRQQSALITGSYHQQSMEGSDDVQEQEALHAVLFNNLQVLYTTAHQQCSGRVPVIASRHAQVIPRHACIASVEQGWCYACRAMLTVIHLLQSGFAATCTGLVEVTCPAMVCP